MSLALFAFVKLIHPFLVDEVNKFEFSEATSLSGEMEIVFWELQHRDSVSLDTLSKTHNLSEFVLIDRAEQLIKEESNNISYIKQDFIRENRGGSLMKSLERLPGISTIGIGAGASKPLIRGLGFNQVMVVESGIKHEGQQWGADHGLEIDQYAADEVVVIKGPVSFEYGPDAIAGVIDIREKNPPAENGVGGSLEMGAKSNNAWIGGSANLRIRKDQWFTEGRVTHASYGDFRVPADSVSVYDFGVALHDRMVRNSAGNETNWLGRVGYLGKKLRNIMTVSQVNSKSGFFANAHGLEPRQVDAGQHDASDRDILLPFQEVSHTKLINNLSYALGNNFIELGLGYQRNDRKEWSQYVNHGYMPPVYPSEMPFPSTLERAFDKEVFSVNLKDGLFLAKHSFSFGASAELQRNGIGGWGFLIPAFRQIAYGMYAVDRFQLNERWRFSGALRYDHSEIEVHEYQDWFPSTKNADTASEVDYLYRATDFKRTFNSLVWSVGFNFVPGDLSFKGNLGTSFRMPIAKELAANGVNYHYFRYEKGNVRLSPERSLQLDLGADLNKENWRVSLSPFLNYFGNYIYLNPSFEHDFRYGAGNQVFNYTQSKVLRYGAELSVFHQLNQQLSLELLGEYVYSKQLSGDKKGYTLPFAPPPAAILNVTYKPRLSGFFSAPYAALDFRMTAKQEHIVPPEKITPGYQLVNLRIGADILLFSQKISTTVQVQNLLNTRYLNHTSFYRLIDLPEQGRNISFALRYQF